MIETKKRQFPERKIIREREHAAKVSWYQLVCIEWETLSAKVNCEYYCEHVLTQGLLPVIQAIHGHHNWTLQQDRAPSYTVRNMIKSLHEGVNLN